MYTIGAVCDSERTVKLGMTPLFAREGKMCFHITVFEGSDISLEIGAKQVAFLSPAFDIAAWQRHAQQAFRKLRISLTK
jgi:hypothetical protein